MAKRPEGLSPCYSSLASPDIPESYMFRWTPHTTQNGATINIYASNGTTLLRTYAVSGDITEVDMASVGYTFTSGTYYNWTVTVAGVVSVKARFLYKSVPTAPAITWSYTPKTGDVIVANTYFQEMKTNVTRIISDYDGAPTSLTYNVNELFTGEVVPAREDFETLESVITFLSTQLEESYSIDIDGPVENSLGITDLERIRQHLDMLINVDPKPVQSLKIEVAEPTMYTVSDMSATHAANKDATIDLEWSVGKVPSYNGTFIFEKTSPSKDIRYYECRFEYGPSTNPFVSLLFYAEEDIQDGTSHTFDTDWDGLYTASTLGLAKQSLQVTVVDQRGNRSQTVTVNKTYGSNFKAPLGVKHYELHYQKAPLGDAGVDINGKWSSKWTNTDTTYTHTISGQEGQIYYRVRAVDLSGLTTGWEYSNGVTWDPLTPPSPPTNLKCVGQTTTSLTWSWNHGQRVEKYKIHLYGPKSDFIAEWFIGDNEKITNNTSRSGLGSNKGHVFFIRSENRVGHSEWVAVSAYTKSARATSEKQATKGDSWNGGYNSVRTGRQISGSFWRRENGLVYQGEWCEIKGSPNYIGPPNQCWGKHKGMWIFDDNWWRSTLSGKKIIKVEMWLQRKGGAHGYYNDQVPTFWLHNYDNFPSGQPSFFGKFQPGKEFDLGESGWVTLPNWYGEYIRDNKAKGIGIYRDNWGRLPYIKFYSNAKLRITYE